MSRVQTSTKAFTLIELVVTVVILGILAALAVPAFSAVTERSKRNAHAQTVNSIVREAHALAAFDQAPPIDAFVFASGEPDPATDDGLEDDSDLAGDMPAGINVSRYVNWDHDDDPSTDTVTGVVFTNGSHVAVVHVGDTAGVYTPITASDVEPEVGASAS